MLQLRAFSRTAELRSISRAADTLALAPPAVALLVRELEYDLDATLVQRGRHDVTLTPAGECLYALVHPLLEGIDEVSDHVEDRDRESAPTSLHVIAEGGVTVRIGARILQRLFYEHPELDLRVRAGSRDEGLRRLLANEAGFAFGAAKPVPDDFVFRPLLFSGWAMIAPPGHPLLERETVTLREVGQWPTIAPSPQMLSREPEGDETPYRHPEFQRNVVVETDGWPAAQAFVEAGIGITVADELAIPRDARIASVPLADRLPTRVFGLFQRSHAPEPRFLRLFVEAAQGEYPDASSMRDAATA